MKTVQVIREQALTPEPIPGFEVELLIIAIAVLMGYLGRD